MAFLFGEICYELKHGISNGPEIVILVHKMVFNHCKHLVFCMWSTVETTCYC